ATLAPPPATSPLSLHDALPISFQFGANAFGVRPQRLSANLDSSQVGQEPSGFSKCSDRTQRRLPASQTSARLYRAPGPARGPARSEEHTSELQSRSDLVCRLLL